MTGKNAPAGCLQAAVSALVINERIIRDASTPAVWLKFHRPLL
jgi:hypothetical protein